MQSTILTWKLCIRTTLVPTERLPVLGSRTFANSVPMTWDTGPDSSAPPRVLKITVLVIGLASPIYFYLHNLRQEEKLQVLSYARKTHNLLYGWSSLEQYL